MSQKQVKKCSKCGSDSINKKTLGFPVHLGFGTPLKVTAYICNKCGYIELYSR